MIPREEYRDNNVVYGITTRQLIDGEFIDPGSDRLDLLSADLGFAHSATQKQVHGDHIRWVDDREQRLELAEGDGLITTTRNLLLAVRVADCCGVVLWDDDQLVVAAIHSGWRGTAASISAKAVQIIEQRCDIDAAKLHAWLSPCASAEAYLVRSDVQRIFPEYCRQVSEDQFEFDNKGAIRDQLVQSGLHPENITVSSHCTIREPLYHSYRRDAASAGRMLVYCGIV